MCDGRVRLRTAFTLRRRRHFDASRHPSVERRELLINLCRAQVGDLTRTTAAMPKSKKQSKRVKLSRKYSIAAKVRH